MNSSTNSDNHIMRNFSWSISYLLFVLFPIVPISVFCQTNTTDTVFIVPDLQAVGKIIPENYIGLSYETKVLLPDENGHYYFNANNKALVNIFKSLGVKSLRIGGNSVDVSTVPIPVEKDIDMLFTFAKAAGVKVIYSVRLNNGDPQSAAKQAKYICDNYAGLLDYFSIGNEPSYYKDYENQLKPKWQSIMLAMQKVAPCARFCAPDDNPNPALCQNLLNDFSSPQSILSLITFHSYPGNCAYKNPFTAATINDLIPFDAKEKRELLLSEQINTEYEKIYNKMEPVIAKFPYRLSETNSIWYGGLEGASNTYAATLWGLDYMHWWANHGAQGINFHTGDKVGGGEKTVVSRYAAFVTGKSEFDIRPLSYAIKAFSLGSKGNIVPITISENAANISVYAVKADDGTIYITSINKNYNNEPAQALKITLGNTTQTKGVAEYILLKAPAGDISAKKDITLGDKTIAPDGTWKNNKWRKQKIENGMIDIEIPTASALIIKVKQ